MTAERPRHPTLVLIWKIASISFGGALILLGVVGLFLPILQGIVMILAGLAILSAHSRRAKAALAWLKEKLHIGHKAPAAARPEAVESRPEEDARDDRRARM